MPVGDEYPARTRAVPSQGGRTVVPLRDGQAAADRLRRVLPGRGVGQHRPRGAARAVLLDLCDVGPRTRLVEIGSGWGSPALRAASRGARVTTITLSSNQRDAVRRRAAAAGLGDLVDVRLMGLFQCPASADRPRRADRAAGGSPCRTSVCWQRRAARPGSPSTSFPAASSRSRPQSVRSHRPPACTGSTSSHSAATTPTPCGCGGNASPSTGKASRHSASTRPSAGPGGCTRPARRPASPQATSTSTRWCSASAEH